MINIARIKSFIIWLFVVQIAILFTTLIVLLATRLVLGQPSASAFFPKDETITLLFLSLLVVLWVVCVIFGRQTISTLRTGRLIFVFATVSMIFGMYVASETHELTKFDLNISSILFGVLFFLTLPTALTAFNSLQVTKKQDAFKLIASMLISIVCIYLALTLARSFQEKQRMKQEYLDAHPTISSIEPKLISNGNLIIIHGEGFGPLQGNESQVIDDNKISLQIINWKPDKIIAIMRSASNPGELRIVKPSEYKGSRETRISNGVSVEFYDPATASAELKQRYFSELRSLSNEGKTLYGINSF